MTTTTTSLFGNIPDAPFDPILGMNDLYLADTSSQKVNLGVGAYRDDKGRPQVLSAVKKAERKILEGSYNKEYLAIDGLKEFNKVSADLIFGADHRVLKEKKVLTVQTLSGTGAVRLGAEFILRFFPPNTTIYLPHPTWNNHNNICEQLHLPHKFYKYYHPQTNGLDFDGMVADLNEAPSGSVVLLHGCAHNPTGVDPSKEQWQKLADLIKAKKHFPFFDVAYQGFATGDLEQDAYSVRLFADQGLELFVTQSYAKNFGLYAERVGALNVVLSNPANGPSVLSQLKVIARTTYSNPPVHGARIVALILTDPELRAEWVDELKEMSQRIQSMRKVLYERLKEKGTPGDWSHILKQIGMFSFTGLSVKQAETLINQYHIYLLKSGRISMAGLNSSNVDYVANAIHEVVIDGRNLL